MSRIKLAFGALLFTQIAHSIEEYVGRLWESFPPARFLTGMISSDRELGFIALNSALVAFGFWCLLFPVRRDWPSAARFIWFRMRLRRNGDSVLAAELGRYTATIIVVTLRLHAIRAARMCLARKGHWYG